MNQKDIRKVSENTIARYSNRFRKLGTDVKTLGWGNRKQQRYRFQQTLNTNINFENRIILDIGCGFGDYYKFLDSIGIDVKKYIGWDLNDDLLREAKSQNSESNADFERVDISEYQGKEVADISVMLGLLNWKLDSPKDNYEYSINLIERAFSTVKECLIVDFLSTQYAAEYDQEDFVFYHDPTSVLEFCMDMTDSVVLKHDYEPIPQREFMVYMFK